MFIHSKTNKKYYSVREKIKYYKSIIEGKLNVDISTKRKARLRLRSLYKIEKQSYSEPTLVVTDDSHFGNGVKKPRLCVAFGIDNKQRIKVFPIRKRTTNSIIIDNNLDRQIESNYRWLDKSDIYEIKYIDNVKPLSKSTKKIIKHLHKKII